MVKEIPTYQIKMSEIEIISYTDSPGIKKVVANTKGHTGTITLWEGDAYDSIGQWTDEDVKNRILELYK